MEIDTRQRYAWIHKSRAALWRRLEYVSKHDSLNGFSRAEMMGIKCAVELMTSELNRLSADHKKSLEAQSEQS